MCGVVHIGLRRHAPPALGLQETIALVPLILGDGVLPRIEKLTCKSMAALRAEWRASIALR